ncbi:MAG TPA: hypothetical protein VIC85_15605 [Ktedonobacterales bacterium]|jgi:hypothetical protein
MGSGTPPQRSGFAEALTECCARGNVPDHELARRMIADGFPSHHYSQQPARSQEDEDWLTDQIQAIRSASITTLIVFDQVDLFIQCVARCLPSVGNAKQRLARALRDDEWTRFLQGSMQGSMQGSTQP